MKTIIFDFGNVVAFFDHRKAVAALQPFSPFTVEEMFAAVYAGQLEDQFERGLVSTPMFLKQVHQLWQLRCDIEFMTKCVSEIFWPNPEVHQVIAKLKPRYRILLGSNTNAVHARRFLTQFAGVLRQFDALILSHEVGTRKPDADFYHHCLRFANAKASECIFIDDLSANIEGARAAGLHGIVYRPNNGLVEQLRGLGVEV